MKCVQVFAFFYNDTIIYDIWRYQNVRVGGVSVLDPPLGMFSYVLILIIKGKISGQAICHIVVLH